MLRCYIVTTKEFVRTSPIFSFCFVFKHACMCCVHVYTSLCLVISHSVFVLMCSVINSPLVGLVIYIFTYLQSVLVEACLSPSASGETASVHLPRFEPALIQLKHSSVAPQRCSKTAGHIQKSAERKMGQGLCTLRKKNKNKTKH